MIWKTALFSAAVLALAACESTTFTAAPTEIARPCPPLVTYSCSDQKRAAAALYSLPPESPLKRFVDDYGRMRKQCGVPTCTP